jgi:adenylate cyclase
VQKYVYDLFGPGVNLAARMETLSEPMKITLCEDTYELIKNDFICSEVGEENVKGFGVKMLYHLEGEHR